MPEQLTPSQQAAYAQYYGDLDAQRNAISQRDTNEFTAKIAGDVTPYLKPKPAWGMYGGGGQGDSDASLANAAYRNTPIPHAVVPTYMMPYKKSPRKNPIKTIKQVQSAIYTPKKPKALTKSQKIVIAEMFGKQITTNPKKKQNMRR